MKAFRFFARLLYFSAVGMGILIILMNLSPRAHAAGGVDHQGQSVPERANKPKPTPEQAVERFTENMTAKVRAGKTDPFVGRADKIRRIVELVRHQGGKNLILLGEKGSGKTALIEQAAGQIENRVFYSLSLGHLMSDTVFHGQIQENITALLDYFRAHPEAVLVIDEAVAMVQPGNENLRNSILPPAARGEISAILITTEDEYRDKMEQDEALRDRFETERLDQPTEKELLGVLRSRREILEKHHGIQIAESALKMAAKLVLRYYPTDSRNRKAIQILDGAAAREAVSRELGSYDKLHLQNERESVELHFKSLQKDLSRHPEDKILQDELNEVANELEAVRQRMNELDNKERVAKLQNELGLRSQEALAHEKAGRLQDAATIRFAIIPQLEKAIRDLSVEPLANSNELTERNVAQYVAQEKGLRLSIVSSNEVERLNQVEEQLNKRILFQERAVKTIMERIRIRIANVEKPSPNFILLDGANGVGKSEVARVLSREMYGKDPVVIEGNKYQGRDSSWQLLGSGKGFEDSEKGGDLEPIRHNPEMVVLIDEANLADRSFWEVLYQLSSEGYVRDNRGRLIEARNVTFIMTANFTQEYSTYKNIWTREMIEARFQMAPGSLTGLSEQEMDEKVLNRAMELRGVPPGMRDRLAAKVVFNAFDLPKAIAVARLKLADQVAYLYQEHRVILRFDDSVAEAVAKAGFDMEFNVRPIDRSRSNLLSTLLADLQPKFTKNAVVEVSFVADADGKGGKLVGKLNGAESAARQVVFKAAASPETAAARFEAEMSKRGNPFDSEKLSKRAARRAGKR